jgi:hypothetical protein
MNKSTMTYVALFLLGVILAPKVRSLPLLSKLPTI